MTRSIWILAAVAIVAVLYYVMNQAATAAAISSTDGTDETDATADPLMQASTITQDPSTWPAGDLIWEICQAVALAEGYNLGPGAAPFDCNNPGDLSPGDEHGQATISDAAYHGGSVVIHFATAAGGWQALYLKFQNIAGGGSSVYKPGMTWAQIAAHYAGDSANWAKNVAAALGVSTSSTLAQFMGG